MSNAFEHADLGRLNLTHKPTMDTNLNELAAEVHVIAIEKGWYDPPKASIVEHICLMHSELSEAVEEYRNGHAENELYYRADGKPEGIPAELADVMIRLLDTCAFYGIDINQAVREKIEFNKTRPTRHGGKRT